MLIKLGTSDWQLPSEDSYNIKLHNMYLLENPASIDGISRVSRPTLTTFLELSEEAIKGFWRQDGTLNGDLLAVAGTTLYRIDQSTFVITEVGSIPGTGYCQFAGTTDRVIIVRDLVAYSTDGSTVEIVVIPDDQPVQSIATIDGSFILTIKGTEKFYWITSSEVDPDPLSFASAERTPDYIETVAVVSDEIWFIGTSGVEVWQVTGDADAPYLRIPNRVYNEGCTSRDTVVNLSYNGLPVLYWVNQAGAVVMAQGQPKKISDSTVEEFLKNATNLRAWGFRSNKHDFYVLTADEFTVVYDTQMDKWMKWDSYLLNTWRAHLGAQKGTTIYAGDQLSGTIYVLEDGISDDDDPVVREVSGSVDVTATLTLCKSVSVRVNAGWSPSYTTEPILELRWSDDQGATWSDRMKISLGNKGMYSQDSVVRSLGIMYRPGRIFEFRFTDKARFRIDYATVNEV